MGKTMIDVAIDMTGCQCGYWTVIERGPNKMGSDGKPMAMWLCECACGTRRLVRAADLRDGSSKSCGCYQRQRASEARTKHSTKDSRLYSIWAGMRYRCTNPKHPSYYLYGGRGIQVCYEWANSFDCFARWSYQHGYQDTLTIDRIDNDGDYSPENCRWISPKEQANNRRTCVYLEYNGETKTITQWGEEYQISPSTIESRIQQGWAIEDALTRPVQQKRRGVTYQGVTRSIAEWAKRVGISPNVIAYRLSHGWTVEEALFKPVQTNAQKGGAWR